MSSLLDSQKPIFIRTNCQSYEDMVEYKVFLLRVQE